MVMYKEREIVAMIPARGGSKRLKNKNILPLLGKPMISYAINACKQSKLIDAIYVSTESDKIAEIALKNGVKILKRPDELAQDNVSTQAVMQHFADCIKDFTVLCLVQANSPQVQTENIDKAIKLLIDNNLWEVRSINSTGLENGAFWIIKRETIYWKGLSVYFGVVKDDAMDIHTTEDFKNAEKLMRGL
jgi:CMP-N,N'-diacetyllegionaminic acid synthase